MQGPTPSSPPAISVIIPVYNGQSTIGQCLERLFDSTFRDFEVIVVNDGSTDDTAAIVGRFACRFIASAKNSGQAAARNLGAAQSSGRILFFLDADILIRPDTLSEIVDAMANRPEISALSGSFAKTTVQDNFASVYKNLRHHYTHQTSNEEATTFCGGFGAIRREAFFAVGGFNPNQRFVEDIELGYRLHHSGHRIWLHKRLQLVHAKRYTLAQLIHSDFLGRAIPWTRLMLESRLFRSDLNTQAHNVWSVPLSFLLLAALPVPALWMPLALPLILVLLWLNRGFLGFTLRERGWFFAFRAALMCWFGCLYGGIGALLGLLTARSSNTPQPDPQPPLPSPPTPTADPAVIRTTLVAWFGWLGVVLVLTGPAFLWQVNHFKSPGAQYYRLFVALALCSPMLLWMYQLVRRSRLWRYEFGALTALPIAASLLHETWAALVALWVFVACYGTGRFVRKKLRLETAGSPEEIAISSGIGFGTLLCLLFAMGLAGLYHVGLFAGLLAAPCILFRREIRGLWDALAGCHRGWTGTREFSSPLGALLVASAAIFTLCATAVVLAPSLSFDVLKMHLPAVQFYAARHGLHPVPNLDYAFYPQGIETLMTLGYVLAKQPAAQMLPPIFFALTLPLAFHVARKCGCGRFPAFAGVLFAVSVPALHWSGSVAKNDYALAFFILAAVDCYLCWRASGSFRWIQLGVFFVAMGAGVKHIVLFALPAIGLLYLYAVWRQPRRLRALASLVLVFAVFGLFWHVRTYLFTGNPVYPESLSRAVSGAVNYQATGPLWRVKLIRYVALPWNLYFHGARYFESSLQFPLGVFLVAFAPLWIFVRKPPWNAAEKACLLVAAVYLAYWATSIAAIRYAIVPLAVLHLSTARRALAFHFAGPRLARASVFAAAAYCLLFAMCGAAIVEINGPQFGLFAGRIDRQEYLRQALATYRSLEFLRGHWTPGDWLFGVGNCSMAYAPDPLRFDCMLSRSGSYTPELVEPYLRKRSYQYLVLPRGPLESSLMGGRPPLYQDANFAVYRLAAASPRP